MSKLAATAVALLAVCSLIPAAVSDKQHELVPLPSSPVEEEALHRLFKRATPVCSIPATSLSVVGYFPDLSAVTATLNCPVGYCPCSDKSNSGALNRYIMPKVQFNNVTLNPGPAITISCANMTNFCVCTTGQCFKMMGSTLESVGLYPFGTGRIHFTSTPINFQYALRSI